MSDAHGPIDFLLLEFTGGHDLSKAAAELIKLVDSGVISLYDLVAIRKEDDDTYAILELDEYGEHLVVLSGARSGLLGDDDLQAASEIIEPGTTAVLLMFENTWAIPFVGAALDAGGSLVASMRIPALEVMAALDELEAS
jgi:hypothetical protein